ncbi:hypothetical protein LCGC14_2800210, partial [marine sediment metagenome]
LAGFEGSAAPKEPELELDGGEPQAELGATELTDEQIDAIDTVDSLAGNTVDGVPVKEFINDVSDLTGDMETAKEA